VFSFTVWSVGVPRHDFHDSTMKGLALCPAAVWTQPRLPAAWLSSIAHIRELENNSDRLAATLAVEWIFDDVRLRHCLRIVFGTWPLSNCQPFVNDEFPEVRF
jgi:hypothetical protein